MDTVNGCSPGAGLALSINGVQAVAFIDRQIRESTQSDSDRCRASSSAGHGIADAKTGRRRPSAHFASARHASGCIR